MERILANIKHVLKVLACKFGRYNWPAIRPRLQVLAYHRILPEDDLRTEFEQPGMWVTPETFEKNIVWLKESFDIIRLKDWVSGNAGTLKKKNYCCITFDDGWLDNYEYLLPILKRHDIPVTLFCVSEMIEGGLDFWPGRLTDYVGRSVKAAQWPDCLDHLPWLANVVGTDKEMRQRPLAKANLDRLINGCKRYSDADINKFLDEIAGLGNEEHPFERRLLNVVEIREMIETGLVDIGSHTKHHARLDLVKDRRELEDEIRGSKRSLQEKLGVATDLFCYPNGVWTPEALVMVREHYLAGCSLKSGWVYLGDSLQCMKRFNMHEGIANNRIDFLARLSGFI